MTLEALKVLAPLCGSLDEAQKVLGEILSALGAELEWAVAEFDRRGNVIQVSGQDWDIEPVRWSLKKAEQGIKALRDNGVEIDGAIGLASRIVAPWVGELDGAL